MANIRSAFDWIDAVQIDNEMIRYVKWLRFYKIAYSARISYNNFKLHILIANIISVRGLLVIENRRRENERPGEREREWQRGRERERTRLNYLKTINVKK